MDLRYILTRSAAVILLIVFAIYAVGYVKKLQRRSAIASELKSLSSESSFFHQFSAEEAQKSLVRAVGLIAEANQLGMEPDTAIDRALGIEEKYFAMDEDDDEPSAFDGLIRNTLKKNYENFRRFGYDTDFHTLQSLRNGELPPVRSGPRSGSRAVVGTIIDPTFSEGLEMVVANLEIRPETKKNSKPTDIEIAAAKQLVKTLRAAGVIEEIAETRILQRLQPPPALEPEK